MIVNDSSVLTIRQKLSEMVTEYDSVFWLDSCGLQSAFNLGAYELIVGLGVNDILESTSKSFD